MREGRRRVGTSGMRSTVVPYRAAVDLFSRPTLRETKPAAAHPDQRCRIVNILSITDMTFRSVVYCDTLFPMSPEPPPPPSFLAGVIARPGYGPPGFDAQMKRTLNKLPDAVSEVFENMASAFPIVPKGAALSPHPCAGAFIVEIRTRCISCSKLFAFLPEAEPVLPPFSAEQLGLRIYAPKCPFCSTVCEVPHPSDASS